MKRFIIILGGVVLTVSGIYFLLEQGMLRPRSSRIVEIIGDDLDSEYLEKTTVVALGFKRFLEIESRKVDFWLKRLNASNNPIDISPKAGLPFYEYISSNQYCSRIRVVSDDYGIVFSTSDRDIVGSTIDRNFYRGIIDADRPEKSRLLIDPLMKSLVFYRSFNPNISSPSTAGNQVGFMRYYVLFYYDWDVFDSLFGRVETLAYRGVCTVNNKFILINFPEVESDDEEKLADLLESVSVKESGAARVLLKEYDKTVYYRRLSSKPQEWIVGITTDTEQKRISKTGIFIIVLQSLVVISLLLVVILGITRHRRDSGDEYGKDEYKPKAAHGRRGEIHGARSGKGGAPLSGSKDSFASDLDESEDQQSFGGTVVPLNDIEEVTELEELGEAEIAGGTEEEEGTEEMEETFDEEGEVSEIHNNEQEHLEKEHPQQEVVEVYASAKKGGKSIEEGSADESILDDAPHWRAETEEFAHTLPDLEKLAKAQPLPHDGGDGSTFLRSSKTGGARGQEKNIRSEEATSESLKADAKGQERAGHSSPVPPSEGSETAHAPSSDRLRNENEEIPPMIPEEVFREKKEIKHDDELAQLIDQLEENGEEGSPSKKQEILGGLLRRFIKNHGLSRGAILLRERGGRYIPYSVIGFEEETRNKLYLNGSEKIVKNVLLKDKILYIHEDAFMNNEVREKFGIFDSSKIKNLFFAPLIRENSLHAVVVICSTMGERADAKRIIDDIKKLRQDIAPFV